MNFDLFKYLTTIGFIFIYIKLIWHYGSIFLSYMLDQENQWNIKFERPRILFVGLGLGVMHLAVYLRYTIESGTLLVPAISFLVFLAGFFLSILPGTEKFKSSMQGQTPVSSLKKNKNFNLNISEDQAQKLYHNLMRYDLLNSEKTSLQDFRNVLTKDWDAHNSKIHFNMDGPSSREFYEYLSKAFPKNTMTIKNLFITSELVLRRDGKKYKYNTLKNAFTRTPVSKQNEVLINIFRALI